MPTQDEIATPRTEDKREILSYCNSGWDAFQGMANHAVEMEREQIRCQKELAQLRETLNSFSFDKATADKIFRSGMERAANISNAMQESQFTAGGWICKAILTASKTEEYRP